MSFVDRPCGWRWPALGWAAAAHALLLAMAASAFHVGMEPGVRREALRVAVFRTARPAPLTAQAGKEAGALRDRARLVPSHDERVPSPAGAASTERRMASAQQASIPPADTPGPGQPAPPKRAAPPADDDELAAYTQAVRSRLLEWRPRGLHLAGTVTVAFSLDRSGRVTASRIAGSGGNVRLDRLALRMVRQASPFPPPPEKLPGAMLDFELPVRFH